MGLSAKLNAVLVCAFMAGLAMFYFLSEPFLRRVADEEVLTRARIMMAGAAGVRKDTAEEVAPLLTGSLKIKFHPPNVAAYAGTKNFEVLRAQVPAHRYPPVAPDTTNRASR